MLASTRRSKASKGSVVVKSSNERLQLVFTHGGKRQYLSLGLADTPRNRRVAARKAAIVEEDIHKEQLDPTLDKYRPQSALTTPAGPIQPSLVDLWEQFLEFKRPQCSPSTMRNQYGTFTSYLKNLPTHNLDDAAQIREHCLQAIPVKSCKRFITRLNACCKWAREAGLISKSPFEGMASSIVLPKGQDATDDIDPFSVEERDAILDALLSNHFCSKYARVQHSYYFPYVQFLFKTGCRPSEAIALQWKHIIDDFQFVQFEQAVVINEDEKRICKNGLKTQAQRRFICNQSLRDALRDFRPQNWRPEGLVFPGPISQRWMDPSNFQQRIWTRVIEGLKIRYRKPYQTRHTFITLALEHGLDVKDVARLVGNSPEVIYKHYAGKKKNLVVPEF